MGNLRIYTAVAAAFMLSATVFAENNDYKRLDMGITRDYKGSVVTNHTEDYLINTTGRSPQWNLCIPLSELQTNTGIPADFNNPDPTGFTGDPQKIL